MAFIVPSRFAGLRIEDDDEDIPRPKNKNKNPKVEPQQKPNKPAKKPKKPQIKQNPEQWEKWQEKDSEIVNNYFEKDLEEALLMSKLDFEANKDKYAKKEDDKPLKSKKSRPLSLQDFQNKIKNDADAKVIEKKAQDLLNEQEKATENLFFEQINKATKEIISKEKFKVLGKEGKESNLVLTEENTAKHEEESVQEDVLVDRSAEIKELKTENVNLKNELATMKSKYKKICSVLKYGEMKDRTDLLIEIEKLKKVQADMQTEMTSLYAQLEQEKSKTNSVNFDSKHKEKIVKKSVRFDASTEVSYSENKF